MKTTFIFFLFLDSRVHTGFKKPPCYKQTEQLLCCWKPKAAPKDMIRRQPLFPSHPTSPPTQRMGVPPAPTPRGFSPQEAPRPQHSKPPEVHPLSESTRRLSGSISASTFEKLVRVKELMNWITFSFCVGPITSIEPTAVLVKRPWRLTEEKGTPNFPRGKFKK